MSYRPEQIDFGYKPTITAAATLFNQPSQALANASKTLNGIQNRWQKSEIEANRRADRRDALEYQKEQDSIRNARAATLAARQEEEYQYKKGVREADTAAMDQFSDPINAVGNFNDVYKYKRDKLGLTDTGTGTNDIGYHVDANGKTFGQEGYAAGDNGDTAETFAAKTAAQQNISNQAELFASNTLNNKSDSERWQEAIAANPESLYARKQLAISRTKERDALVGRAKLAADLEGRLLTTVSKNTTSTSSTKENSQYKRLVKEQNILSKYENELFNGKVSGAGKTVIAKMTDPDSIVEAKRYMQELKGLGLSAEDIKTMVNSKITSSGGWLWGTTADKTTNTDGSRLGAIAPDKKGAVNWQAASTAGTTTSASDTAVARKYIQDKIDLLNMDPREAMLKRQSEGLLDNYQVTPSTVAVKPEVSVEPKSNTLASLGIKTQGSTPITGQSYASTSSGGTVNTSTYVQGSTTSDKIKSFDDMGDEQKMVAYYNLKEQNPEGIVRLASSDTKNSAGEVVDKDNDLAVLEYMEKSIKRNDTRSKAVNIAGERGSNNWKKAHPDLRTQYKTAKAESTRLTELYGSLPKDQRRIGVGDALSKVNSRVKKLQEDSTYRDSMRSISEIRKDMLKASKAQDTKRLMALIEEQAKVASIKTEYDVPTSYAYDDAGAEAVAQAKHRSEVAQQDALLSDASAVAGGVGTGLAYSGGRLFGKAGIQAAKKAKIATKFREAKDVRVAEKYATPDRKIKTEELKLKRQYKNSTRTERKVAVEDAKNDIAIAETPVNKLTDKANIANKARRQELVKEAKAAGMSLKNYVAKQLKLLQE